jgi:hypothetical protein
MPRTRIHRALAPLLAAALAAAATPAHAATTSTPHACSAVVPYGKQICLTLDSATAPTKVTATLIVQSGGRGWYGEVEIDGPNGELTRTGDKTLGAPATWPVTHAAAGAGKYCAIDWRWDVYTQTYFEENSVCVNS